MNPGLISVIVPCYNQGIYLKETIQSALASTYRPLEILIINDGSTDNSLEIAKKLEAQHPEVRVLDQANAGVTKARNVGIAAAQGEYILPLDGDDLISTTYIEKGMAILSTRPEVTVVYCQAEKFSKAVRKPWKLKPFSLQQLAKDNMIFVSALFRKADALGVGGFSEDMQLGREDWEFWIKLLKNGGEVVLTRTLVAITVPVQKGLNEPSKGLKRGLLARLTLVHGAQPAQRHRLGAQRTTKRAASARPSFWGQRP